MRRATSGRLRGAFSDGVEESTSPDGAREAREHHQRRYIHYWSGAPMLHSNESATNDRDHSRERSRSCTDHIIEKETRARRRKASRHDVMTRRPRERAWQWMVVPRSWNRSRGNSQLAAGDMRRGMLSSRPLLSSKYASGPGDSDDTRTLQRAQGRSRTDSTGCFTAPIRSRLTLRYAVP